MSEIESVVRTRLRSLRKSQGLSLDDLAERSHLSPSTISRIETGKRSISLDVLLPLARALRTDVETLLEDDVDGDVIIRPTPSQDGDRTTWMLTKATGNIVALKVRLEPVAVVPEQRVHPGHDWFFVLEGRVRLLLGDRQLTVEAGEAAEFATMTPHAFAALGGPAEVIMIFDRDGHQVHRHDGGD
ncbi:helix-turn-helix domain-containing protein [Demetria terragena]|uniref:helix-turn-helix domain-containing protein n=1 Tax=Demetria terragena TaxID=63959 RepID=UPI00037AF8F9|nr:XRE family transcriptional regulator [Demetria terragena]